MGPIDGMTSAPGRSAPIRYPWRGPAQAPISDAALRALSDDVRIMSPAEREAVRPELGALQQEAIWLDQTIPWKARVWVLDERASVRLNQILFALDRLDVLVGIDPGVPAQVIEIRTQTGTVWP